MIPSPGDGWSRLSPRKLLLDHAKLIKDSSADYRQLLTKVKEKLARERGFIL